MDLGEQKEIEIADRIELAMKTDWEDLNLKQTNKRLMWFEENFENINLEGSEVRKAYTLLLIKYLGVHPAEVPIVEESDKRIVWRSYNDCPVIGACNRSGFDTREVCSKGYERSVDTLIKKINPKLQFFRNYEKIRPYTDFCEEGIKFLD
ncbi:MAG: hypothetical protein ACXAD7_22725 [Candidatus Kariarchaeaceae archaeon]